MLCSHLQKWKSSEAFENLYKYHKNIIKQKRFIKLTEENAII